MDTVDSTRRGRNGTYAVMPRFLPIGKEAKGAAGFLLAALPALGALLTALAISGDLIGRMARNHPLASFGAFGSAALAVFLGAIAAYGLREGSQEERAVLSLGIVVLGAALVFGVYAGVETWGDRAQPSITVTPKSGLIGIATGFALGMSRLILQATHEMYGIQWPGVIQDFVDLNWLYFSFVLFAFTCVLIFVVSLVTPPAPAEQLAGLTYSTVTRQQKATERDSYGTWEIVHTCAVLAIIAGIYIYFW